MSREKTQELTENLLEQLGDDFFKDEEEKESFIINKA